MSGIDKTANGVTIEVGLRVFTNDWVWGTVVAPPKEWDEAGWWDVALDGRSGHPKSYNGDRMSTREPR